MKMSKLERRWARCILETMFPGDASAGLPQSILDLDVDGYLDETMQAVPWVSSMGMRAGFACIAMSPPFTIHRLATIDRLTRSERERVLHELYNARSYYVRQLAVLAKTTGAMLFCAAPSSRRVMQQAAFTRPRFVNPQAASGEAEDGPVDLTEASHVPA